MKITGNSNEMVKYLNETTLRQMNEATDKPTKRGNDVQGGADNTDTIVHLSATSREIQKVKTAAEAGPDIRSEKVEAIKNNIAKGTHEIDYDLTAEKMVKAFLDDMI